MRAVALLLILANVCVYFWAQYVDVPEASLTAEVSAATPQQAPSLRLANETDQQLAAAAAQINSELTCISVGPLADAEQSAALAERLQAAGFSSVARNENAEVFSGFWVSLQGFASVAEAEQTLKKLHDAGISDAYVLAEDTPPVLSLGLFSEQGRADNRSAEITKLGFQPVVQTRTRPGQAQWLDVSLQEPGQAIDPALLQPESAGIVRLETRACAAANVTQSATSSTSSSR